MPTLSKNDVHALRHADSLCIHLSRDNPTGRVALIKRKAYDAKPFETDQEYMLDCEVRLETTRGREALASGAVKCFDLVGIYHSQNTPVSTILKSLRVGDEIVFCFQPDQHCNGYVAAAGLHADALALRVNRNNKSLTYELATSICPNNSGRMCFMCYGVPKSCDYDRAADERRAIA